MDSWRQRARALRDELVTAGKLSSPAWQQAVLDVPRHHFVPAYYQRRPDEPGWHLVTASEDRERWWEQVYANLSLVTEIGAVPDGGRDATGPVSSSSAPGLMTRMLEMLDVQPGMRVLEIGTGTGYNAALLAHRLGDSNVFSLDVGAGLVESARQRLAELDYHPTLVTADGIAGLPEHAPYDRIIATCAVPRVPWAWAEQTRYGGLVLVDVKVSAVVGNLVLLRRDADQLTGQFDGGAATFMQMRTPTFAQHPGQKPERDRRHAQRHVTGLRLERPWEHGVLWFLLHLTVPGRIEFGYSQDPDTGGIGAMYLYSRDGSWCEVTTNADGTGQVWEAGPRPLWQTLEQVQQFWAEAGQPGWERFGLTVTANDQHVWLDNPDSPHRWPLPA
ncbi:methyltransferase domain-containing protein [Pseudonocardia acaciae]|uniref:methyltransferase domain-containing protein n=1 Tax=Pseudonocardia acaciae TaxID=551276 RepID=UPI001FE0A770|nr:methyltransferase domain-containing protein [Pseudonocardia acaciae]